MESEVLIVFHYLFFNFIVKFLKSYNELHIPLFLSFFPVIKQIFIFALRKSSERGKERTWVPTENRCSLLSCFPFPPFFRFSFSFPCPSFLLPFLSLFSSFLSLYYLNNWKVNTITLNFTS